MEAVQDIGDCLAMHEQRHGDEQGAPVPKLLGVHRGMNRVHSGLPEVGEQRLGRWVGRGNRVWSVIR